MLDTREFIEKSSDYFQDIAGYIQNTFPEDILEDYGSFIDHLSEGCQLPIQIYWYTLQSTESITEEHVIEYNYLFENYLDEDQLFDMVFGDDYNFIEMIQTIILSFARLEAFIHITSEKEIELTCITDRFLTLLDSIGLEFYRIIESSDTFDFNNNLIEVFRNMVNETHQDLFNENTKTYDEIQNQDPTNEYIEVEELSFEELMVKLNKLVGMDQLKQDIQNLINLIKIQQVRASKGMKSLPVSKHLVFTGNPGTGKTTVARILAQIYKSLGILPQGQLIETDRAGLVAGYVGQTAIKTDQVIKNAIGGILFIDEAYTLSSDDYGREAIDTILKRMEDHRDKLVVIVAGYPERMIEFIHSNPGLESRFNKYIHFEDYTPEEMTSIFKVMCEEQNYTIDELAIERIYVYFQEIYAERDDHFSNGRLIRNLFEKTISQQANRLITISNLTDEDLSTLTIEDLSF